LNLQLKVKALVKLIEVSRVRRDGESVDVRLSSELAKILYYDNIQQNNIVLVPDARYSPDLHKSLPTHICIYSDIVEPQLVGDTFASLLRIINTNIKNLVLVMCISLKMLIMSPCNVNSFIKLLLI